MTRHLSRVGSPCQGDASPCHLRGLMLASKEIKRKGHGNGDWAGTAHCARIQESRLPRLRSSAELERLRDSDTTVRVIDSLAVYKDASGEVEVEHLSNLSEARGDRGSAARSAPLIGLGIAG